MRPKSKVTIMVPWVEVVGPLIWLKEQDGELLAEIGEHIIVLPIKLNEVLTPLLGHSIALLATDIVGREYLVRELAEDKQDLPISWKAIVPGSRQEIASMTAGSY
jgi:hypothetical protein